MLSNFIFPSPPHLLYPFRCRGREKKHDKATNILYERKQKETKICSEWEREREISKIKPPLFPLHKFFPFLSLSRYIYINCKGTKLPLLKADNSTHNSTGSRAIVSKRQWPPKEPLEGCEEEGEERKGGGGGLSHSIFYFVQVSKEKLEPLALHTGCVQYSIHIQQQPPPPSPRLSHSFFALGPTIEGDKWPLVLS